MKDTKQTQLDEKMMRRALELAEEAAQAGEVPVGAVICQGETIIAEGRNSMLQTSDPCGHAEIIALRRAAQKMANYRLPELNLYVTIEPCTMCLGAIIHARLARLVFAASEPKSGALLSNPQAIEAGYFNHELSWDSGVLEAEASSLISSFFTRRREEKKRGKKLEKN